MGGIALGEMLLSMIRPWAAGFAVRGRIRVKQLQNPEQKTRHDGRVFVDT
ncbi:hypothetical protein [Rhodanobacter geophilus]|uniref:Uncharacterized protein n=1 Tax=Rhodanobacter geophilus TaxID=3162488 RepID=A0ABV3QMU3_9GAMM